MEGYFIQWAKEAAAHGLSFYWPQQRDPLYHQLKLLKTAPELSQEYICRRFSLRYGKFQTIGPDVTSVQALMECAA
jgi:hypothetical protein